MLSFGMVVTMAFLQMEGIKPVSRQSTISKPVSKLNNITSISLKVSDIKFSY